MLVTGSNGDHYVISQIYGRIRRYVFHFQELQAVVRDLIETAVVVISRSGAL
ncbi:hypothetical protein SERLADRAFT_379173 [Serpula lacrymans var. lacrymans S7.9]|uniref:Uncharacterized protein n=1 Tax=Serpula lacrymans var. lacrymans (strain S7.9) TaxID=578457 RepID=F8NIK5_SERL9|nr:uncharacterized protein SERLADRAFT_379173 [Serpula lacrymans var. lacrymans S7.9]EGO29767.1 hypothetical protein SERLADRAFT_379173 [Serpula lacrymans var. lacrymans S7.9]